MFYKFVNIDYRFIQYISKNKLIKNASADSISSLLPGPRTRGTWSQIDPMRKICNKLKSFSRVYILYSVSQHG